MSASTVAERVTHTCRSRVPRVPDARLVGPHGAPVVAVLGGISATSAVCDEGGQHGWWRELAGPGRVLDTRDIRVLGWTYPSPEHGRVTTRDHARALVEVLDELGIDRLDALIGAS